MQSMNSLIPASPSFIIFPNIFWSFPLRLGFQSKHSFYQRWRFPDVRKKSRELDGPGLNGSSNKWNDLTLCDSIDVFNFILVN